IATDYWRAARLLPDGSVIAIFEGLGIFRVDSDSRVRWAQRNGAHHDFAIAPDGTIWALVRDAHLVPRVSARGPILEDSIAVLDPRTGEEKRRFSLLEAFERGPEQDWTQAYYAFWKREGAIDLADSGPDDIFHTNSIEILDDTLADVPGFRPGNLLVSMRNLDMIAVVDPERESVVWSRAGLTTLQHDPSVTPDGALLVFDNQWQPLQRSRVVWLDPRDDSVRREWAGTEASPLYSHSCGTSQLLANGNVLVVETDQGRVLEVAPDDAIVWEFRNPHRAGEHGEYIASVFGMTRVPRGSLDWLAGS
ncbi:MAG: aryl-sulfate sulfotransferase, partial [Gemmatimonadetes bacterium]|nr:aryl-sulfate sulfotransferase [Gemmatimonadota bacterium]